MSGYVESPTKMFTAGAALAKNLRVKLTAGKLAAAGSTDHELGTITRDVFADLDVAAVRLRTAQGTCPMVASEAITAGNPCYAATGGKVAASGTVLIGIAIDAATADGDIIEVLRRQETSDSAAAGGTTAAAFEVDSDATTPKIALAGQTGGTGDYTVSLLPASTLTGDRSITFPDAAGAVMLNDNVATVSGKKKTTEKHTAGDTLLAAESGSHHSNTGASGTITLVLPAALVGMEFDFYVGAAQQLRLDPAGSETIALPSTGVQGAAGKYLVADAVGEFVRLVCETAGAWLAFPYAGTWTAEP